MADLQIEFFDTPGLGGPYWNDRQALMEWINEFHLIIVCIKGDKINEITADVVNTFLKHASCPIIPVVTFWDLWRSAEAYSGISEEARARLKAKDSLARFFPNMAETLDRTEFVSAYCYQRGNKIPANDKHLITADWNIDSLRNSLGSFVNNDPVIGNKHTEPHLVSKRREVAIGASREVQRRFAKFRDVLEKALGDLRPKSGYEEVLESSFETLEDDIEQELHRIADKIENHLSGELSRIPPDDSFQVNFDELNVKLTSLLKNELIERFHAKVKRNVQGALLKDIKRFLERESPLEEVERKMNDQHAAENRICVGGLNALFNLYLDSLDNALPNSARKNDHGAALLNALANKGVGSTPSKSLDMFEQICREFRKQQYRTNERQKYEDTARTWLRLVVCGGGWQQVVHNILGFSLPQKLNRIKEDIVFQPVASGKHPEFLCHLLEVVDDVKEEDWDEFDDEVRQLKKIRAEYNVDNGMLRIFDHTIKSDESEGNRLLQDGQLPSWLELLLDRRAIKYIDISYPLLDNCSAPAADIVQKVLVRPTPPPELRFNDGVQSIDQPFQTFIEHITARLDGTPLFHVILTQDEPEWAGILNHFIHHLLEMNTAFFLNDPEKVLNLFSTDRIFSLFLSRYLSLPSHLELRNDNFKYLEVLFHEVQYDNSMEQNRGTAKRKPRHPLDANSSDCGKLILDRIGQIAYLDWAVKILITNIKEHILLPLHNVEEQSTANLDKGKIIKKVEKNNNRLINRNFDFSDSQLAATYLESVCNTLQMLQNLFQFTQVREEKAEVLRLGWLRTSSQNQTDESSLPISSLSYLELTRIVLTDAHRENRVLALSALFYLFAHDDAIPDTEINGELDDHFIAAHVVRQLMKNKCNISHDVDDWARRIMQKVDGQLNRVVQDTAIAKLDDFKGKLCKLSSLSIPAKQTMTADTPMTSQ